MISFFILILSGTLKLASGESVKVVGEVGQKSTTLSCPYPPNWTKCTFVKESQHFRDHEVRVTFFFTIYLSIECLSYYMFNFILFQASCEIKNGDQSVQSCFQFNVKNSKSWLYIEREHDPPRCFLEIVGLQREHNGTYSCFFEDAFSLSRRQVMVDDNNNNNNEMLLSSEKSKNLEGAEDQEQIPSSLINDHHRIPSPLDHDHHRIPSTLTKYFTLTVLQWPSYILVSSTNISSSENHNQ